MFCLAQISANLENSNKNPDPAIENSNSLISLELPNSTIPTIPTIQSLHNKEILEKLKKKPKPDFQISSLQIDHSHETATNTKDLSQEKPTNIPNQEKTQQSLINPKRKEKSTENIITVPSELTFPSTYSLKVPLTKISDNISLTVLGQNKVERYRMHSSEKLDISGVKLKRDDLVNEKVIDEEFDEINTLKPYRPSKAKHKGKINLNGAFETYWNSISQ